MVPSSCSCTDSSAQALTRISSFSSDQFFVLLLVAPDEVSAVDCDMTIEKRVSTSKNAAMKFRARGKVGMVKTGTQRY